MNKSKKFIIDEKTLIETIKKYGKGIDSKDYEYAVSILMKRKLEASYHTQFSICFEIKPGVDGPARIVNPTAEDTIQILREMLNEDTPVDFGLVKGTVDNHSEEAFAFQVKRFDGPSKETFNKDLLEYLHKVLNKFRPGETNLVVIPRLQENPSNQGQSVNLDVKFLKNNLAVPKQSFLSIFILFYDNRSRVIQLWPPV